ncbi:hypothetical protein TWF225_007178 [Orbilia oligospora]|uniref:Uncharacterized protein n=1 Tax=Orbilia oligospora TaxID=2813651 RepID=A0A7C8KK90_ORBOL|nr:hypothetical protein TWF751_009949 [Orbilia oligospora]KAF3180817.1 hypothetical protein TWF225_007178 [Orbilia oligospora]KAF3236576.1 hypothetical protein TWF128_001311 [Orbilia oligospora]KAF3287225.1 hypothetical protein TWF132_008596 [Orbilia oligospora]TGJ69639.1 hypothetical protein EYR41_005665 [Orbilia oligospora]
MLAAAARRSAVQALQTTSRRMASTAAHPPSSVHTKISAGIGSHVKGSSPNLSFYTARFVLKIDSNQSKNKFSNIKDFEE